MAVLVRDLGWDLSPGAFDIPAPKGEPYPHPIDVVVVPGLGFNGDRHRLGYGGGYYDRYLAEYQGTTIGCFYHGLLCDFIPESHDRALDFIITERGLF